MVERLEDGPLTLTSFVDLGRVFAILPDSHVAPYPAARDDELLGFMQLPVLDQLIQAREGYLNRAPIYRTMMRYATKAALEMDREEREHAGITLMTYLPPEFAKPDTPLPDYATYLIYSFFPHQGENGYIDASRHSLQGLFADDTAKLLPEALIIIDDLMRVQVEQRPETFVDRHRRLIQQIKAVDSLIKTQKRQTPQPVRRDKFMSSEEIVLERDEVEEVERLNALKLANVSEFFGSALSIEDRFPYLYPLFRFEEGEDTIHKRLHMQMPYELNLRDRLFQPDKKPIVGPLRGIEYATNINTQFLQRGNEAFERGSQDPIDDLRHGVWEIMQHRLAQEIYT